MGQERVEYSQYTKKRIEKMAAMKNLSDDEKAELLDTLSLPDDQLKQAKNRVSPVEEKSAEDNEKKKAELLKQLHELDKASGKSEKADPEAEKRKKEYLEHYDKKINEEQETYKKNQEKLLGESSQEKQDEKPRKKEYLFKMIFSLKKRHKNYLEERKNYSAKAKSSIRRIEEESGNKVKCVVDKNFIRAFRKLMGVGYRGGAIMGKRVIVEDAKTLEDEAFLRHEAIHCAQQRDMGRWKRLFVSLGSVLKKKLFGDARGTPEAMDYATDNQATDKETYMNQFTTGYLRTREKNAHKKYYNKSFLQGEYKRARERILKEKKAELALLQKRKQLLGDALPQEDADNIYFLEEDIDRYGDMLDRMKDSDEVRVVLTKKDVPASKEYDGLFQVRTEESNQRKKRLKLESGLQTDIRQKLEAKKEERRTLLDAEGFKPEDQKKVEALDKEIKQYDDMLYNITGNRDKK